jgi:hypothetical protein
MKLTRHKAACRAVIELLSDYTTETLPWRARLTVRAHLRRCLGCSTYERQLVEIIRACRNLAPEALGEAQLRPLLEAFAVQNFGHSV